jgi:hypothetical protein
MILENLLKKLSAISVKYLKANQGALYIIDDTGRRRGSNNVDEGMLRVG